jgi:protease I
MSKRALIITGSLVQDHEFIYPFYRLQESGFDIEVFNGSDKQVLGYFGTKIPPQKDDKIVSLDKINVKNYDILILPGGIKSMEHMRLNKELLKKIKEFDNSKKVSGCICSGIMMLISAKVTKSRKLTGYHAWRDDIENSGAEFLDEKVVIDENIVTSPHYKYVGYWMKEVLKKFDEK